MDYQRPKEPMPLAEWKVRLIEQLKRDRLDGMGQALTYIHVPKCAGTTASAYLARLHLANKSHHRAAPDQADGVTFAIIRNPIERFESFLNYRLSFPEVWS